MNFLYGFEEFKKYIEIKTEKNTFADYIENEKYALTREITQFNWVQAQIVIKNLEDDIIFKSNVFKLRFDESINAAEEIEIVNKGILDKIEVELIEVKENIAIIKNKKISTRIIETTKNTTKLEINNMKNIYVAGTLLVKNVDYVIKDNVAELNFTIPAGLRIIVEEEVENG